MIDARADFAGALNEANARLASIDNSLRYLLGEMTLNLAQIAKRQQVSRTQVSREPWRVPGFGANCDAGKRPWACYISTYIAWIEIPEEKRREKWDLMTVKERRKVRAA